MDSMNNAPKWPLAPGSWEDAESWVGRILASSSGVDEITRPDVRRKLEVLAFDCPLYLDDEVAQRYGYPRAPALSAMLMGSALPAYWSPGDPRPAVDSPVYIPRLSVCDVPAPGDSIFATNIETEFIEPLFPGNRISSTARLVDITRKTLKLGDGAFMTVETEYMNEKDKIVGKDRLTVFRYVAKAMTQEPSND